MSQFKHADQFLDFYNSASLVYMYNHSLTSSVFWNNKLNHMVRHRGKLSGLSAGRFEWIKQTEIFLKKTVLNPSDQCHLLKNAITG